MATSNGENSQRVSVLAAVCPTSEEGKDEEDDASDILDAIAYGKVVSSIRSSDDPRIGMSGNVQTFSSTAMSQHKAELAKQNKNTTCHACGKKAHWKGDSECLKQQNREEETKKTVTFS